MRELARARDDWAAAGAETAHAEEMALFTLLSTKNSEHTWGISSGVTDTAKTTGWDNAAFHAARRNASGNPYAAVERAWRQQRTVGIDAAVASLEGTPLHADITARLARLEAFSPSEGRGPPAPGFEPLRELNLTQLGGWLDLGISNTTGAIVHLRAKGGEKSWASEAHPLALLRYQTLVEADLVAWRAGFLQPWTITPSMASDYGRPGMNVSDPNVEHHLAAPTVRSSWIKHGVGAGGSQILVEVAFASELHEDYGAPSTAWLNYTVPEVKGPLTIEVSLTEKTATRLPEAMFLSFNPPAGSAEPLRWSMQKLDSWLGPEETLDGGAKGLHAVSDAGLRCTDPAGSQLTVGSWDAALLKWGEPTPFPNPCLGEVDTSQGASYVLFDNLYDTNVSALLCRGWALAGR